MATDDQRHVFVVGKNRLQNDLINHFLTQESGCRCSVADALCDVQPADISGSANIQRMILYDCHLMDSQTLLAMIRSEAWVPFTNEYRVLFNLPGGTEIEEALSCGFRGFFYCDDGISILLKGVSAIFQDDFWVPRKKLAQLVSLGRENVKIPPRLPGLSRRETDVLRLLPEGLTNREIADRLCVSHYTVKAHLHNVFKKIGVSNRLQAAQWAEKVQ